MACRWRRGQGSRPFRPAATAGVGQLAEGGAVQFKGADPADPAVCLVAWNGRTHRYLDGFWGSGRFKRGTPAERAAIRQALTGPVGAKTSFEDTRAGLWGQVTVEHVANPVLRLAKGPRRTVQLRITRHDAGGRPDVQLVSLHWIDVRTGVALKRQVVTRYAGGRQVAATTWQIDALDDAS